MTQKEGGAAGDGAPQNLNLRTERRSNITGQVTSQGRPLSWSVFDGREYVGRIVRRLMPAAGPEASVSEHLRRMGARERGEGCFEALARGGHSVGIFNSRSEAALALKGRMAPFGSYPCVVCGRHECDDADACALEEMREIRRRLA